MSRILKAYRNVPAADEHAIEHLPVKLSQLVADFPEIREINLNPVLADETGVIAVDARVSVAPVEKLIAGFPATRVLQSDPIPRIGSGMSHCAAASRSSFAPSGRKTNPSRDRSRRGDTYDLRLRFFAPVMDFSHTFIARFTQIDYAHAMAFIAIDEATSAMLGVVRLHATADYDSGEYAILVRSDMKGHGLGWQLMQWIIEYARGEGIRSIKGQVLHETRACWICAGNSAFASHPIRRSRRPPS